jgi:hypothetical protein
MIFLGRYKKEHTDYEDFKRQGVHLTGNHRVAEICRGILRDYWRKEVKEKGDAMTDVSSPIS